MHVQSNLSQDTADSEYLGKIIIPCLAQVQCQLRNGGPQVNAIVSQLGIASALGLDLELYKVQTIYVVIRDKNKMPKQLRGKTDPNYWTCQKMRFIIANRKTLRLNSFSTGDTSTAYGKTRYILRDCPSRPGYPTIC